METSGGLTAANVSLRLGHGAALTCHRHVIHYRVAASLPGRGDKGAEQRYALANSDTTNAHWLSTFTPCF